jgi:hypothetical protein
MIRLIKFNLLIDLVTMRIDVWRVSPYSEASKAYVKKLRF